MYHNLLLSCGHEFDDLTNGILEEEDLLPPHSLVTEFESFGPSLGKEPKAHSSATYNSSSVPSLKRGGSSSSNLGSVGPASSGQTSQSPSMLPVLSLEEEIDEIMGRIPGVKLDQADIVKRTCSFKLSKGQNFVDFELLFPENYPIKISPSITITQSNLDTDTLGRLMKTFTDTCNKHVKQHVNCVEPCVRQILHLMEKAGSSGMAPDTIQHQHHEDRKSMLDKKYTVEKVRSPTTPVQQNNVMPMYPTGSFQDSCIPFPRTCGATFCSNDRLVVFGVPVAMKKVHEDSEVTPRALSDLVSYTISQSQWMRSQPNSFVSMSLFYPSPPPTVPEGISVSSFYTEKTNKNRHHRASHHHHHHKSHSRSRDSGEGKREKEREVDRVSKRMQKVGSIKLYDISIINPVSKYLAENYKLDLEDIPGTCDHNAAVAMKLGRKDLVQLWHLISQMSHPSLRPSPNVDHGPPWAYCPFGRPLVNKMLNHYARLHDVQTMAMICCMFWDKDPPQRDIMNCLAIASLPRNESRTSLEYAGANHHAETTFSSSTDSGWHVLPVMKSKRSLSWSESYDDFKVMEDKDPRAREVERERILHHNNSKMLDPELRTQHEQIKKAYANILFKWNLLNERTQMLKHTDSSEADNRGIEFAVSCYNCFEDVKGVQCNRCKYPALRCSICHIGVRGAANFCIACGHGGHTSHMMEWFKTYTVCPSGCGCSCLQENCI